MLVLFNSTYLGNLEGQGIFIRYSRFFLEKSNHTIQFLSAISSRTGQIYGAIKQFIKDQICHKLVYSDGEATWSNINSTMRRWSKYVSVEINGRLAGTPSTEQATIVRR